MIRRLKDHREIVTNFQWFHNDNTTNDKCQFITSSLDKTIRIYKDYECTSVIGDHNDWIRCLGLSLDNRYLLSGCVSSVIMCFDLETTKPLFKLKTCSRKVSDPMITINGLQFARYNTSLFVSGTRDGTISLWDKRDISKSILSFEGHNGKINSTDFIKNDCCVISSGRDNTIRMWDVRMIRPEKLTPVMKYNAHKCFGYNIQPKIFNNETNIVTGSEEKDIFIYDIDSGNVVKTLKCPSPNHIIHIVDATIASDQLKIVSSSIEKVDILRWTPINIPNVQKTESLEGEEELFQAQRTIIETLMSKFGDRILELFHKQNVTISSPMDWQSILHFNGNNLVEEISADLTRSVQNGENIFQMRPNNNQQFNESTLGNAVIGKKSYSYEYCK